MDVVDGRLAGDFASDLRHFGGRNPPLASTIWRGMNSNAAAESGHNFA
jgi:hypothetical protein